MNLKPHHVGISVANLNESIVWYIKHFDCTLESINEFPEIKTKIAFLFNNDFRFELFEHYETQKISEHRMHPLTDMQYQGTLHICFISNNIEATFKKFSEEGVEIVIGPMLSPPKDALMGFIKDNSGNLIEFIQTF